MTGRPTRCTVELANRIAKYIRAGSFVEPACKGCNIAPESFYEYIRRRGEGEPFSLFADIIDEAESALERDLDEAWLQHGKDLYNADGSVQKKGDWRAIESFSRRRWRKRYCDNSTTVKLDVSKLDSTIESVNAMCEQVLSKMGAGELTLEQSKSLLDCLELRRKMIETSEQAKQLAAIEQKLGIVKSV